MSKLKSVALSYIGTPHINGGNVKGENGGLDCCTLITQILKEMGHGEICISFGYSADWFCKKDTEELMLPYLEKYFDKVNRLKVGDVITYRWGRAEYAHISMMIARRMVIHCDASCGVEAIEADNPKFYDRVGNTRISGFWRLKDEFIQGNKYYFK